MKKRSIVSMIFAFISLPLMVLSCVTIMPPEEDAPKEQAAEDSLKPEQVVVSDFMIGAGDVLDISVYRQKDLDTKVVIPPEGSIFLPLIGEVRARGIGVRQLREQLIEGYSKYLVNPAVSIKVEAIRSLKAYVLGEVRSPGMITLDTQVDVVEAITRVGGPTPDGELSSVLLIRGNLKKPEILTLNIKKALGEADLTQSLPVQRGDIIYVPRSFIADVDRFFRHFASIIGPIASFQSGIAIWPAVEAVLRGDYTSDLRKGGGGTTVVSSP